VGDRSAPRQSSRFRWIALNYDIPFNPNRLEQRIGRVDRYGQNTEVDVVHFVGTGWETAAAGSYDGDLEFLSRVARKVAAERRDLGSVNPVLAGAVEARMLGRPVLVDPLTVTASPAATLLRAEKDLRAQAQRLRAQLDTSITRLHVAPANVRRVVDVALGLAQQPPLVDGEPGEIRPPQLRSGWESTLTGLADPLSGVARPMTFDADIARGRDDVVLAHLGHPLVAQATRLLQRGVGWPCGPQPRHRCPLRPAHRARPARSSRCCAGTAGHRRRGRRQAPRGNRHGRT